MAGAVGFEPTVHEIKTRCLTTWLRPNLFMDLPYFQLIFKYFRISYSIKNIIFFSPEPNKIVLINYSIKGF